MFSRVFLWLAVPIALLPAHTTSQSFTRASDPFTWMSDARLHRGVKSMHGSLTISGGGVDFHPEKNAPDHWPFEDIRIVDLQNPRRLSLVTYQNRRWHIPGDRTFVFDLKNPMPPRVAATLIAWVGKPAINGDPAENGTSSAIIRARHRTRTGGSNGILRFRADGIDYVTTKGEDSRSWRWADIQTLAHPELYRLRIAGYLETFDFELKEPLPDDLFDRLWDHVYGKGSDIEQREGGRDADVQ